MIHLFCFLRSSIFLFANSSKKFMATVRNLYFCPCCIYPVLKILLPCSRSKKSSDVAAPLLAATLLLLLLLLLFSRQCWVSQGEAENKLMWSWFYRERRNKQPKQSQSHGMSAFKPASVLAGMRASTLFGSCCSVHPATSEPSCTFYSCAFALVLG